MGTMRWVGVGVAMALVISGPAMAQPAGELGELDYWCLPECMAVGFHDRDSGTETILFEHRIDMAADDAGRPAATVEIGEMWLEDGRLDAELDAFCYSDSIAGPVDGVVVLELADTSGQGSPSSLRVDFVAQEQIDPREHQSMATEASIALGPSLEWGGSWYRSSVTAVSDLAEWCAYEGRMISVPAADSD